MKQKDELFLQLLRDKLDFFVDKSWKELVICKKMSKIAAEFDKDRTIILLTEINKKYII